jgi:hypothetical protein
MYIGVKCVAPLPDYRLMVTFENGERRIFDVTPYLDQGIFRELKDLSLFNSVRVQFDTVEWANGADLCPECLYAEGIPAEKEAEAAKLE